MHRHLDRILARNKIVELGQVQEEIEDRYRQDTIVKATAAPPGARKHAHLKLNRLPRWTAYDALRVHKYLLDLLGQQRWHLVHQARSENFTWEQIGEALGITRQGIHDWYRRAKP